MRRPWPVALLLLLIFGTALPAAPVSAQDSYPSRPIRIVVPFPAGGPSDVMARMIGDRMSQDFGQASWSITGQEPIP